MDKLVKDLTQDDVIKLCDSQRYCENCPYKMFEVAVKEMTGKITGYSVCIANVYAFNNDNKINLETGEISKTEKFKKQQKELEEEAKRILGGNENES